MVTMAKGLGNGAAVGATLMKGDTAQAMSRQKGAPCRTGAAQAKALLAVAGLRLPYPATVAVPVLVVQ